MDGVGLIRDGTVQQEPANINIDDAVLVERCREGDSAAMERLIVKYQDRVFNTVLKICANRDDAMELTQDAFVKVLENLSDFRGKSSFYTWVFRIAVNLTLNYCQRRGRAGFESLDEEKAGENEDARRRLKSLLADERSPDPAELAQKREICELLYKAIAAIEESHRAVIVLRDIEGMSYSQIAETLNIELGTVKSRLSRARNSLREILEAVL